MARRAELPNELKESAMPMLMELGNKLGAGLTSRGDLKSRVTAVILGTLAVAPFTSQLVIGFGVFAIIVLMWIHRHES